MVVDSRVRCSRARRQVGAVSRLGAGGSQSVVVHTLAAYCQGQEGRDCSTARAAPTVRRHCRRGDSSRVHHPAAHRQVLEAQVSQGLRLRLVHAVRQLREDAVHVLEERAKQHLLPPRLEQRQLRRKRGTRGKGGRRLVQCGGAACRATSASTAGMSCTPRKAGSSLPASP